MSVLSEALEFLGLAEGSKARNGRYESGAAKPRKEQRELAEAMRRLPDRLPARTLEKIKSAAASGQWEKAVDRLVTALHARDEAVTTVEREDLRAILEALNMPTERVDNLAVKR